MSNVQKQLEERNPPALLTGVKTAKDFDRKKEKIKKLLSERQYGEIPSKPDHMYVKESEINDRFACGRAVLKHLDFTFEKDGDTFSFPALSVIPKGKEKCPAFVYISFGSNRSLGYTPLEEIIDRGFAVLAFSYNDIATDDDNFRSGIAKYLVKSRRKNTATSKIALWAWAAMRLMDYIETLSDVIDIDNVAVVGHSRLGKTALLAGGFDDRFKYIISNDSGCAGAALERGKIGERYDRISEVFPYWFCPRFNRDAAAGVEFPFDQHFLLSLSVPRHLIIGSAQEDTWADPKSEFLSLAALEPVYKLYKKQGLVHGDDIPKANSVLSSGDASYYLREGTHFMSRHDWNVYMDIIESKMK